MKIRQAKKIIRKAQEGIPYRDFDGTAFNWEPLPGKQEAAVRRLERGYQRALRREYEATL